MAEPRPYFNWRIDQLETLHRANPADPTLNQALLAELEHRSTDRAAELRSLVQERMLAAAAAPPTKPVAKAAAAREHRAPAQAPTRTPPEPARTVASASLPARPVAGARSWSGSRDQPAAILAAWIALEALTPQTYRRPADLANEDRRRVAALDDGLPWFRNERSRPNYQLYYQLILGAIRVDRATGELIRVFGNDEESNGRDSEKAAIAAVLLDRNGVVLEENAVGVSSFAWALPIALSGNLAGLDGWANAERGLIDGLTKLLSRQDREGNPLPVDQTAVDAAFQWLVQALGLPEGMFEAPSFALRVYHHFKAKTPPEVTLLNSFFLADLSCASRLLEDGRAGKALGLYLGLKRNERSGDLLNDLAGIEALIAPGSTPSARWPAPGGHPLVTLQQAAVNAVRSELGQGREGIVAVNGPPGTGKTTLLRDIVAACVLDRANALYAFEDPAAAFSTTGQKISAGGNAFLHLYRLNDTLKGHEVLVASSNNKAVENVSRELPSAKAIAGDLRYFKTVSDRLMCKKEEDGSLTPGEPTWGLIAAVLGNASNRGAFQDALWWDKDRSLRLYLKAAKGDAVVREVSDETGRVLRRETPAIVAEEKPPNPEQARTQWRQARVAFAALKSELDAELAKLESLREACRQAASTRRSLAEAVAALSLAQAARDDGKAALVRAEHAASQARAQAERARQAERESFATRPGWFSRWFRTQAFRQWQAEYSPLASAKQVCGQNLARAVAERELAEKRVAEVEQSAHAAEARVAAQAGRLSSLESIIEGQRPALGDRLVDEGFFARGHEAWNLASPWIPDRLHARREALFAAALELHRAFIGVAAQKIAHNLGALMGAMQAGAFKDETKRALLGDLWSTLYLVVPVLSTTFASVDRMLGDLPASSLGWLLVDEAGQATPQAAVGAIMRARRVIVVGDPLQVPPVVSLPQRIVSEVGKYFNLDAERWLAPEASVQTVADAASRFCAEFRADVGVRQVGIPLLVHRRCQEPMFGISNNIAYDGQMVHAVAADSLGPIVRALGPSAWIDVDGDAESKWCRAEGEQVVQLLHRIGAAGVVLPDVYIITPFRVVSYEMRRRLESEADLFRRFGVTDVDRWLRERVGTIHTFQGKEAEAVIAVLGAPLAAQQGARRWATASPNILNVMVSRAKSGLYVVGSRASWGTMGHAQALAERLPRRV